MSHIALKVNEKLMEFKATQTTIGSLPEELISIELVDSTRECVEKCKNDLAKLHIIFTEFFTRVTTAIEEEKEKRMRDVGGSGTIHK